MTINSDFQLVYPCGAATRAGLACLFPFISAHFMITRNKSLRKRTPREK
jgi:hypothetical protein